MRFKIPVLFFVFLMLISVPVASAQPTEVPANVPVQIPNRPVSPVELNQSQPPAQPAQNGLNTTGTQNNEATNVISETKNTLRERVQQSRNESLRNVDAKRTELQQKLAGIRDNQKTAIVQRLDSRFVNANNLATDRWTSALEVMSSMLERASSQAADLKDSGVNTFALDSALTRAQTALTTAETAVATQAQKTYVLNVTTEEALKMNVGSTVSQFRLDLSNTYNSVVAAKQALKQVMASLAAVANSADNVQASPATNSAEVAE